MSKRIYHSTIAIVILLLFASSQESNAQRWKLLRYSAGFGGGVTQTFADIGGTADENNWFGLKDISLDETSFAVGGNIRYKLSTLYSLKANLNYGGAKGSDAGSKNDRGRSYTSNFFEFAIQGEFYFLSEEPRHRSSAMFNKKGMINNYSTLGGYLFVGLGVNYSMLSHNYGTSIGPQDDYKSTNLAPVIPFGIGIKYMIDERWYLEGEFGYRWAMNDYVEGYKQTISSKANDLYYFGLLTLNYRIETSRRGLPIFLDRKNTKYRL